MVLLLAVAGVPVGVGSFEPALAGQPVPEVVPLNDDAELTDGRGHRNARVQYVIDGGSHQEDRRSPAPRGARRQRALYYVTFPYSETQADGSRCVRVRRRAFSDPVAAAVATDSQDALWRMLAATFPVCQRTPVDAPTPAARAAEYWRVVGEDLLPRPSPRIAPGYMLAGKLAYLEAGTVPTVRFEHPTPAGLLAIEARAQHWVDWGDGSGLDGPFDHPGGPWPNGTITHYWTGVGRYDVRVLQRWTGNWSLGGVGGELAGLVTEGVIEDFLVDELQAVINR